MTISMLPHNDSRDESAYQLVHGTCAHSVDQMQDQLQDKDHQEKRRHGGEGRKGRNVGQLQRMPWRLVLMVEGPRYVISYR